MPPSLRVAAFTPLYPPGSRVGAWLATHELLKGLAARGHKVEVLPNMGVSRPYALDGVVVFDKYTDADTMVSGADVVLSHLGDNGNAHRLAQEHGKPSVRVVHGGSMKQSRLNGAALAVFNSEATAAQFPSFPGQSIVVRPITNPDEYRTTPGDKVTLVNLSDDKGGSVFWMIAAAMPDVQFLGVRGYYGEQVEGDLPNVELSMPTRDMRADVYSRTRLLLMPSLAESWGMTAAEAMCSGIPVLAHPTPGLRECLGQAGVWARRGYVDEWVWQIRRLLEPETWAEASERALKRSAELDPEADLARFCDAVEAL